MLCARWVQNLVNKFSRVYLGIKPLFALEAIQTLILTKERVGIQKKWKIRILDDYKGVCETPTPDARTR
jgi:hypothetical protein